MNKQRKIVAGVVGALALAAVFWPRSASAAKPKEKAPLPRVPWHVEFVVKDDSAADAVLSFLQDTGDAAELIYFDGKKLAIKWTPYVGMPEGSIPGALDEIETLGWEGVTIVGYAPMR